MSAIMETKFNNNILACPNLFVIQTRSIPVKLLKSVDSKSEKEKGKSLRKYTTSMELLWHGEFYRLFQYFHPHQWLLRPTFSTPRGLAWLRFKDSAKVRFMCKICGHAWTSMRGRVVFWFVLDEIKSTGIVLFRLFGQRCQMCAPVLFEHAMWYPEEVIKVVGNVFTRIGQEYYGFFSPAVRIDRREGKPTAKHNSNFCQACCEGLCPGEYDFTLCESNQMKISTGCHGDHTSVIL